MSLNLFDNIIHVIIYDFNYYVFSIKVWRIMYIRNLLIVFSLSLIVLNCLPLAGKATSAETQSIEEVVKSSKPNRSIAFLNAKSIPFLEYYISGEENGCAFYAFNTKRKEAIDKILEKINPQSLSLSARSLIAKAICYETDTFKKTIFGGTIPTDLTCYRIQRTYLNYYKDHHQMVECAAHFQYGGSLPSEQVHYTLLDVLAYVYKTNLVVYVEEGGRLFDFHKFSINPPRNHPTTYLLLRGSHYSRLVPTLDTKGRDAARQKENVFLNLLRERLLAESVAASLVESHPAPSSISFEQADPQGTAFTPPPVERTLEAQLEQSNRVSNSVSAEQADSRESFSAPLRNVSRRVFRFTEQNVKKFLKESYKRTLLPGIRTFQDSLQQALDYLEQKENNQRSILNKMGFFQARARLILDRQFTPESHDRRTVLQKMVKRLKSFINKYKNKRDTTAQLLVNYAYVYQGKALKDLGKYQDAYDAFVSTNRNYTQSWRLDIAEMVVDNGFRPRDMETQSVESYVKDLLSKQPSTEGATDTRRSSTPRTRSIDLDENTLEQKRNHKDIREFSHPGFLNSKEASTRQAQLKSKMRRTQSADSQTRTSNSAAQQQSFIPDRSHSAIESSSSEQRSSAQVAKHRGTALQTQETEVQSTRKRSRLGVDLQTGTSNSATQQQASAPDQGHSVIEASASSSKQLANVQAAKRRRTALQTQETEVQNTRKRSRPEAGIREEEHTSQPLRKLIKKLSTSKTASTPKGNTSSNDESQEDNGSPSLEGDSRAVIENYDGFSSQGLSVNSPLIEQELKEELEEEDNTLVSWIAQPERVVQMVSKCRWLIIQGKIHRDEVAAEFYKRAYVLAQEIGDKKLEAQVLIGLGNARYTNSQVRENTHWYLKARNLAQEIGDRGIEILALIGLGNARYTNGQSERENWYLEARSLAQEMGDKSLEIQALLGLGNARHANRDAQHHTYWYQEALQIAQQIGNKSLEVQALIGLGNARYTNRDVQHHAYWYLEALQIAQQIGNKSLEIQALLGLGNVRYTNDRSKRGSWHLQALELAQEIGDKNLEIQALIGLGNARCTDPQLSQKDWYLKARKLAQEVGNKTLEVQTLMGLGNACYTYDQPKQENWYLEARQIAREVGDKNLEVQALLGLGNVRYTNGQLRREDWHLQALKLAQKIGNKGLEVQALLGLANARCTNEKSERENWYLDAYRIAREIGDKALEVQVLIGLGNVRYTNDQIRSNTHWYLEACKIAREIGDKRLETQALLGIGNVYWTTRQIQQAANKYLEALKLAAEIGDKRLEVQAFVSLGNVRYTNNQSKRGYWYLQALQISREIGDKSLEAQALIGLGNDRYTNNQARGNTHWYLEARQIAREIRDKKLEAQALIGLGNARYTNKDVRQAALWLLEARTLAQEVGDKILEIQAFIGLGNARYTNNQMRENTYWYLEARKLAQEIGEKSFEVQALIGLGNARYTNNQVRENFHWYLEARQIAREIGDKDLEAQALIGLGNARYTNDQSKQENWYLEALKLAQKIGSKNLGAQALIGLGNVGYTNRDVRHDTHWYLEARKLAREIGDKKLEAQSLIGLGNARYTNRDVQHDTHWYLEARTLAQEIGDKTLEAQSLIGLGNAFKTKRNYSQARESYQEAKYVAPSKALQEKAQKALRAMARVQ
jgi:hypothetical protein